MSFYFLKGDFWNTEVFNIYWIHLLIFSFIFCAFIYLRNLHLLHLWGYFPVLLSKFYNFYFYISVYTPFRVFFCIWCEVRVEVYIFSYDYMVIHYLVKHYLLKRKSFHHRITLAHSIFLSKGLLNFYVSFYVSFCSCVFQGICAFHINCPIYCINLFIIVFSYPFNVL